MDIKNIKVYNINKRPNQFVIVTPDADYFQSYKSIIAMKDNKTGRIFLDKHFWNFSTTTGKYRNIFLNENKKLTMDKIENNTYSLINLNN